MKRLLALVLLAAAPASAIQVERLPSLRGQSFGPKGVEVVAGQVLARFDPQVSRAAREQVLAAAGCSLLQELPSVGWTQAALPPGLSVPNGIALVERLSGVLAVEPNHVFRPNKAPNDALFWTQYHLDRINAPQGWDDEDGFANRATIAVLDAGIEGSHPDLSGKFVGTSQFCDPGPSKLIGGDNAACANEASPVAACNHGTRVAGAAVAATNNFAGVSGVSWGSRLVSMRLFRTQDCDVACTSGACGTDETAIINALDHVRTVMAADAATYGRLVVNISLGGIAVCSAAMQTAITNAFNANIPVVVAAGNGGAAVEAPAKCANTIPVGATDNSDKLASFSARGAELAAQGVVAPGVKIVTTDVSGKTTGDATGTSFSAPIVAGLAALLLSENNGLTAAQVQSHIRNGAEDIGEVANNQGAGRVNVCKSLKLAQGLPVTSCASGTSGLAGFQPGEPVVAFPNPFRTTEGRTTTIKIPSDLQAQSPTVKIFTIDGTLVRTLPTNSAAAVAWDGTNENGKSVATGVYLVMVKASSTVKKFKLAVIR